MNHRKRLNRDEREAASLLMIKRANGEPVVSRAEAEHMTAREIVETFFSRVQEEHMTPAAIGRDLGWSRERINHPSNIQYLTTDDHKPKTKRDVKAYYKGERVLKTEAEFRAKILAKSGQVEQAESLRKRKPTIASRAFQMAPEGHKWFSKRG